MKKYKVEITQTDTFIVDITADNEEQAREKAVPEWNKIAESGTHHYHQTGDTETEIVMVYDVTGEE